MIFVTFEVQVAYIRLRYFSSEGTKGVAAAIRAGEGWGVDGYGRGGGGVELALWTLFLSLFSSFSPFLFPISYFMGVGIVRR